jgi:site-specific recombinase XerD
MAGGGIRKPSPEPYEVPTQELILRKIQESNLSLREKAFVATLYVTGARVGEIIKQKLGKKIWETDNNGKVIKLNSKGEPDEKGKRVWTGRYLDESTEGLEIKDVPPKPKDDDDLERMISEGKYYIRKKNKKTDELEDKAFFLQVATEKRRFKKNQSHKMFRMIPVNPERDFNFLQIIWDYLNALGNYRRETHEQNTEILFKFTRKGAWSIIKRIDKDWYPHLLRHARFTHLAKTRGVEAGDVAIIANWSDVRPYQVYVKRDAYDSSENV